MTSSQRIVSLVPSLTELIADLGAAEQLVGRTRFCIHPESIQSVPIIGGTKNPTIDKIVSLQPDLIICNKEENRKEDIDALSERTKATIFCTDILTVQDGLSAILDMGVLLHRQEEAQLLFEAIKRELPDSSSYSPIRSLYLIWRNPYMSVGNDTYIHDVMRIWGLENVLAHHTRYPETNLVEMAQLQPEVILLSSEPYPFKKQHIEEIAHFCPDAQIVLVDGEWFSWYGSRMLPAFKGLKQWRAMELNQTQA